MIDFLELFMGFTTEIMCAGQRERVMDLARRKAKVLEDAPEAAVEVSHDLFKPHIEDTWMVRVPSSHGFGSPSAVMC